MNNYTLPLAVGFLGGRISMATVGFATIPVLIIFIIGQRWIVEAFTKSGFKS